MTFEDSGVQHTPEHMLTEIDEDNILQRRGQRVQSWDKPIKEHSFAKKHAFKEIEFDTSPEIQHLQTDEQSALTSTMNGASDFTDMTSVTGVSVSQWALQEFLRDNSDAVNKEEREYLEEFVIKGIPANMRR